MRKPVHIMICSLLLPTYWSFSNVIINHYSSPVYGEVEYCDEHSVFLYVCPQAYLRSHMSELYQIFCA